jgi:hypothetical protein
MGLLLYIIASILEWVFAPVAYLYGFFASLAKREFNNCSRSRPNFKSTTPAVPSVAPGIPVNAVEDGSGLVVLNGAVLINGNGGPSIDGTAVVNVDYANYQGVANTATAGGTTNVIAGNPLIVSPFVE